jgi:hypothetical protein
MRTPFKTILISTLVTLSAFISVTYFSCNRDKCKTIVCAHGGVCNVGVCICPSGYEGANCETVSRTKFLGNWTVFEKGSATPARQYALTIQPSTLTSDVVISNFYNYFQTPIKGYVNGDTLYIPNQQYEGKVLFGVGFIYSGVTYGQFGAISMRYEVIDTATQVVDDYGYYGPDASDPSAWNK